MVPKGAADGGIDPKASHSSGTASSTSDDGKVAFHHLAIGDPKSHAEPVKGEAKHLQEELPSSLTEDVPPVPFFKLFRWEDAAACRCHAYRSMHTAASLPHYRCVCSAGTPTHPLL